MSRRMVILALSLAASGVAAFLGATYLLDTWLLLAVGLYGLSLFGGLCLPVFRGELAHALMVGIGIGLVGALLVFLPSASFA
jgi:hypothetical protein